MPFSFKFPNPFERKKQAEKQIPDAGQKPKVAEKFSGNKLEAGPSYYPETLEELGQEAKQETDRLRVDLCKAARDTGAIIWVDNDANGAIAMLVEPDENGDQFKAVMQTFNAYGYPKGEFKRSDDGGSFSTEVNWEVSQTKEKGYKFIVRVSLNPTHRAPSDSKFHLFNLQKKYLANKV